MPFQAQANINSYKDRLHQETFSWSDFCIKSLNEIFMARANDYNRYKSLVVALENILSHFEEKDSIYISERDLLYKQFSIKRKQQKAVTVDAWFWDERLRILSSLIGRVNEGAPRLQEHIKSSRIINNIAERISHGEGQILFITGKPGSGKSYSAVRCCQEVSSKSCRDFHISRQIAFNPSKFVDIYNDLKPGDGLIFDDAGVNYSSKDWHSQANKIFGKLLQIIRYKALFIVFTTPDLSFVDSTSKKLIHWWFETWKIIRTQSTCIIRPHMVEINQIKGDILYPYPTFDYENQITSLRVDELDDDSQKEYQAVSRAFKDSIGISSAIELKAVDGTEERDKYIEYRKQGMTQKEIRENILQMSSVKASKFEKFFKLQKINDSEKLKDDYISSKSENAFPRLAKKSRPYAALE